MDCIVYSAIFALFAYIFYKWATINKNFFTKRQIKSLKPTFLFGNTADVFAGCNHFHQFIDQVYYAFPKEK